MSSGCFHRRPDVVATMTGDDKVTIAAHVAYRSGLTEQGKALAFGPVDDAASFQDGDPAMAS